MSHSILNIVKCWIPIDMGICHNESLPCLGVLKQTKYSDGALVFKARFVLVSFLQVDIIDIHFIHQLEHVLLPAYQGSINAPPVV